MEVRKMGRMKPKVDKINSLEQANLVLKEISLVERELEAIDADGQKQINEIKEKTAKKGEELRKFIETCAAMVGAFAEYNKNELFAEKKTVELTFGCFGYRKSTSIHVKKTTLDLLKNQKMFDFIRIKEEPNKEKMAELDDEKLFLVDASRKVKDEFFLEAKKEEINIELLKT